MTEIHFPELLTNADIDTFKKSKRKYQNVKFKTDDDLTRVEKTLEQISTIPAICLYHITLFASRNISDGMYRVLQPYADSFKTVICDLHISHSSYREKVAQIRSTFPKAKIILRLDLSEINPINFDEVNQAFQQLKEVAIRTATMNIVFKNKITITNVGHLPCLLGQGLEHFQNLKNLDIRIKVDMHLLEKAIMNNKSSLERLKLYNPERPWSFNKFPCQLKELTCRFRTVEVSSSYADYLSDQRNLRDFVLTFNKVTNNLLDVLSKNKLLTTVKFYYCTLEEGIDISKLEFLNNILEFCLLETELDDFTFTANAIIDNLRSVIRLTVGGDFFDEDSAEMLHLDRTTVLENLKVLNVQGIYPCKFISKRIKAPSLEICNVDFYSEFLLECKHLRNLTVSADKMEYDTVVKILKALENLECFHFVLLLEDLEKTLKYILENRNNIKHLRLHLVSRDALNADDIVESVLEGSGLRWTKLISLYQTQYFSLEIR